MPTRNINSDLKVNADLTLPNLPTYSGSEVTTLMIAGADVVGKRDLGTNAFNSTSFLPLAGGTMTGALAMGNQNITGGGSFFANLFSVGNEGKVVSTSTLGLQLQATGSQKPIIFSTNDGGMTERMRVHTDGKVGIAITDPDTELEVGGTIKASTHSDAIVIGSPTTVKWKMGVYGANDLLIRDPSNNTKLSILSGGNVGIGTTSPSQKLEVRGSIGIERSNGAATSTIDMEGNFIFNAANGYNYKFRHNGADLVHFDQDGNVGIGTTDPVAKLELVGKQMITAGANASPQTEDYLYIGGDGLAGADAAIYIGNRGNGSGYGWRMFYEGTGSGNNNKLKFKSENLGSPVDVITMLQDGKVGIGTITPNEKLEVNGSVRVGNVKIENANGGRIGLNRNTSTGAIYNNFFGAFQIQNNTSTGFEIQGYNTGGTLTGLISMKQFDGYVGIGTTSPTTKFHIDDNATTGTGLLVTGGGVGQALATFTRDVGGSGSIVISSSDSRPQIKLAASSNTFALGVNGSTFEIADNSKLGTNARLSITNTGNVGIGTTSPNQKFEVSGGNINIQNGDGGFLTFENGSANITIHHNSSGTDGRDLSFKTWKSGVGNTEKMRIDKDGNVGIGTTSPNALLHVSHATAPTFRLSRTGTGQIWQQSIDSSGRLLINEAASEGGTQYTRLAIDDDGNVGIGTTSPSEKLEVVGDIKASSSANTQVILTSGGGCVMDLLNAQSEAYVRTTSAHDLHFRTTDTNRMVIKAAGDVGIGTTSPSYKLDVDSGAVNDARIRVKTGDNNAGAYFQARSGYDGFYGLELFYQSTPKWYIGGYGVNRLGFFAGSKTTSTNEKMSLTTAGNLGIGTTSPNQKLDVRGALLVAGDTPNAPVGSTLEVYRNGSTAELAIHQDDASASSTFSQIRFRNGGNDTYIKVPPSSSGLVIDVENKTNAFVIGITGNVGIGKTSPNEMLEVDGNIRLTDYNDDIQFGGTANMLSYNQWLASASGGMVIKNVASASTGHIAFETSLGEKVRILRDGNVGIGTTSPSYKLSVSGGDFGVPNGNKVYIGGAIGDSVIGYLGNTSGKLTLNSDGNRDVIIGSGTDTDAVFIKGTNGNVGIGETAPEVKLEVAGDVMAKDSFVSAGATASQGYTFHDFGTGWGYKGVQSPSRLGMFTASAERVTIDSDGKVGIGTTSPSQKLHVEGNIELTSGFQIGSNSGSYWQRIRTEDATPSTTNAFNFETRNGSGSFIKHVVIRNDGNVGVGNATPAAKLAVEGTIAHKVYTVATLPSASPAGQRAFVSDSSYSVSDAHGLVTVGSGSNFCPMYSDGTNWRVG